MFFGIFGPEEVLFDQICIFNDFIQNIQNTLFRMPEDMPKRFAYDEKHKYNEDKKKLNAEKLELARYSEDLQKQKENIEYSLREKLNEEKIKIQEEASKKAEEENQLKIKFLFVFHRKFHIIIIINMFNILNY